VAYRSRQVQTQLAAALGLDDGPDTVASETGFVTAAGLTLRHRAGCPLMAGRKPEVATDELRTCGVCGS
jgi:hypothetical protein